MGKRKFSKTRLSLEQQIGFLKSQGLIIDNEAKAKHEEIQQSAHETKLTTDGYYSETPADRCCF